MTLQTINPPELYDPAPNGYSHAVVAPAGRTLYAAGQGGEDRDGTLAADFAGQVDQAFRNLEAALATGGATPADVAKLVTYVVDHDEAKLRILTAAVRQTFGDHLPAQTLVPVPRLALDGMVFEVDATALLGD